MDGGEALLEMDSIMTQQTINIQMVAMVPVAVMAAAAYWARCQRWQSKMEQRQVALKMLLRDSEQILEVMRVDPNINSDVTTGQLARCTLEMARLGFLTSRSTAPLVSRSEGPSFKRDLRALVSPHRSFEDRLAVANNMKLSYNTFAVSGDPAVGSRIHSAERVNGAFELATPR